jgi:hypothetical protein
MNHQLKIKGQAMTEYIIVVAVVALAALTIVGLFGDVLRAKMSGIINAFGGSSADVTVDQVEAGSSQKIFKNLDQDGNIEQ